MSTPDTCPTFMGWQFHRWPCPRAGEITDITTDPAPNGDPA